MERKALKLELEELAVRFSEGWHEGIKIDASDIMLLNEAAEALAQPAQEPEELHEAVISAWSLREVYFDEDGEPSMHRSPPQPKEQKVDWEKLYRLEVKKKEALAAKYERDIKPLTKIVPMAQPEQEPVAKYSDIVSGGGLDPRNTTPPQPAQEPVGKVTENTDNGFKCEFNQRLTAGTKLYTSPQRPWVGLTAQEAAECWTTSATQTWKNFEAKLEEKNNGA